MKALLTSLLVAGIAFPVFAQSTPDYMDGLQIITRWTDSRCLPLLRKMRKEQGSPVLVIGHKEFTDGFGNTTMLIHVMNDTESHAERITIKAECVDKDGATYTWEHEIKQPFYARTSFYYEINLMKDMNYLLREKLKSITKVTVINAYFEENKQWRKVNKDKQWWAPLPHQK